MACFEQFPEGAYAIDYAGTTCINPTDCKGCGEVNTEVFVSIMSGYTSCLECGYSVPFAKIDSDEAI